MIGRYIVLIVVAAIMIGCDSEELPSRDHIPILQGRLGALSLAIRSNSQAGVDSLLSVEILDNEQSSDSLLKYVYGADYGFAFVHLGDYTIFYSAEVAVIDCYIMDDAKLTDRPLRPYFKLFDDLWLLTKFEPGSPESDSANEVSEVS